MYWPVVQHKSLVPWASWWLRLSKTEQKLSSSSTGWNVSSEKNINKWSDDDNFLIYRDISSIQLASKKKKMSTRIRR